MTDTNTVAAGAETSASQANDKRFPDLMKQVSKLGEEASLGRDSLPKLAFAVVKAAADGVIDLETKDAKGNDCAAVLYEKYAAAESKKAIHEHTGGGKKANVSKLRQLISMGAMTTVDGYQVLVDAMTARENMSNDDNKVKPAYPFYVEVAREQLKRETPLDMADLEKMAIKDGPAPKELEKVLSGILKTLEGLTTDGYGPDKLKDQDDLTIAAFEAVRERVDNIKTAKKRMELLQNAAKLGLKLA